MHKLLKGFLIGAGVLLALAAVGVMAINLYVQSSGTQKRIEDALSSGLKAPVHLTSTTVTPWSGLKASGITVLQTPPAAGNFLDAAGFTARFDWFALIHRHLDASEVSLDNPHVEWFQSATGRWEMPRAEAPPAPPKPEVPPEATPAPRVTATPAASPGNQPAPAAPAATPGPEQRPWIITVHKLSVNGASFDFWDDKGIRVLQFAGVQFDCVNPRAAGTEGSASCKYVSLRNRMFLSDLTTNWSFGDGAVKLFTFQTSVAGGQIHGDAQVLTQAKHNPFNVDAKFDGVSVDRLMVEGGEPGGEVTGTLKGWLDLNGNSGKSSSLNGSGHLELAGGKMQNIEILQLLGRGLQIPDLVEMNLKTAEVDARVVKGVIYVDKLLLQSQNLQLTGTGSIEIAGRMALNARLTVNRMIIQRLPAFILTYFKPADAPDSRYIDFNIGNTLGHPKTDLMENILHHRVQDQVSDLMKLLLEKPRKPVEPEGPAP